MVEKGYKLNAAVVKLVDTPDLGSPHSFNNSSNSNHFLQSVFLLSVCEESAYGGLVTIPSNFIYELDDKTGYEPVIVS